MRLNGLKSYHYDIENYPDPVDEGHPFDGIYRRTTPGNGPFYPSEYARSDGTTLEDFLASFGAEFDTHHRYRNLQTFFNAMEKHHSTLGWDIIRTPYRGNEIIVSHSSWMDFNIAQAIDYPGKGFGIAFYYDPSFEGIKGIRGVGPKYKTKSLPPNPILDVKFNGIYDPHSWRFKRYVLGSDSEDVYYHIVRSMYTSKEKDLGVYSEKELLHRGILPESLDLLNVREGERYYPDDIGKYSFTRVESPPKIKGKDTSFRELSWEQYLAYMKELGKREDYSGEDPVYDLTTLGSEKPQRTRKVKKG